MTKRKNGLIISIVIIIVLLIVTIITVLIVKNNKRNIIQEDYSIELTGKFAENDNVKIYIDNVAYSGDYLILKYHVIAKDEKSEIFQDISMVDDEFDFHLPRRILINNKTIEVNEQYSDQITYKVSDTEAILYDVVDVSYIEIPDQMEVEVRFFENDITSYSVFYDDIEEYDEEEEEEVTELENGLDEQDEYIEEPDEEDVEVYLEEDATEDDYEEVEGEYNWEEYVKDEEILDAEETTRIGTIKFKATKNELISGVEVVEIAEEYESNNVLVEEGRILKTPFETFLIINTVISDISYENLYSSGLGNPNLYGVDLEDEDGNTINTGIAQEVILADDEGKPEDDLDESSTEITAYLETKIMAVNSIDEYETFRIQPYYLVYEDDEEKAYRVKIENGFLIGL